MTSKEALQNSSVMSALIFLVPIIIVMLIMNSIGVIESLYKNIIYSKGGYYPLTGSNESLGIFLLILIIVNLVTSIITIFLIQDKLLKRIEYGIWTLLYGLTLTGGLSMLWLFLFASRF